MAFLSKIFMSIILLFSGVCLSQTILTDDEVWIDDRVPDDFRPGKDGWSINSDIVGINTSIHYHGFFDMNNDALYRQFTFNEDSGTCDITFNLVFGCMPSIHDSVKFLVKSDAANYTDEYVMFNYSDKYPFKFLEDMRIYWGNSNQEMSPQCNIPYEMIQDNPKYVHGGYGISYTYSYGINEYNGYKPFTINWIPYFVDDSQMEIYYALYDISILCSSNKELYKESLFIRIGLLSRHLVIWIFGGVIGLILFIFLIYSMIQLKNNNKGNSSTISIKDLFRKHIQRKRNKGSIFYNATSARDVVIQKKKLKNKKNAHFISVIKEDSRTTTADTSNLRINIIKNNNNDNDYKSINNQDSRTNTPETAKNNNDTNIILPSLNNDESNNNSNDSGGNNNNNNNNNDNSDDSDDDSAGHVKLPTTIVKHSIDSTDNDENAYLNIMDQVNKQKSHAL